MQLYCYIANKAYAAVYVTTVDTAYTATNTQIILLCSLHNFYLYVRAGTKVKILPSNLH